MFVLKYIFKEPYHALRTAPSRALLKLMFKYGNVKRYEPKIVKFLDYTFLVPDCISFIFQFQEIFLDQFYKFKTDSITPIILDCGANIGTSCIFFSALYPQAKIIAYEAEPKIAQVLKQNMVQNQINNVEVNNLAVWVDDKGIDLATEGSDSNSIFGTGNKQRVASFRLRDELAKHSQIDMLKIDIEGAEYEVIKDCKEALSTVQNIFIEYHSFHNGSQNLGEILSILEQAGFRYYINSAQNRKEPFVNHYYKSNQEMDLQLNIFAYRN